MMPTAPHLKWMPKTICPQNRRADMSDLVHRLQRIQPTLPTPETESVDHLSLDELKVETVKFGKSHMGKTYTEVWETSQDWVQRFLGHYQSSKNAEHKKVIRLIKLKIEEAEAQGEGSTQAPIQAKKAALPWQALNWPCTRSWSTWLPKQPECP